MPRLEPPQSREDGPLFLKQDGKGEEVLVHPGDKVEQLAVIGPELVPERQLQLHPADVDAARETGGAGGPGGVDPQIV